MTASPYLRSERRIVEHRDSVRRLRDVLRSNVVHGHYGDGKMPGETDLMRQHAASRAVVREALQLLRDEGLIDRLQGYGTYTLEAPRIEDLIETHGIEHVARSGLWQGITHSEVTARRPVRTPDAVAALMPTAGETVFQLDYAVHARDDLVGGATNYFRYPEAEAVAGSGAELRTDFYEFLNACGLAVGASELVFGASVADSTLTAAGVPAGTPIFIMEQTIRGDDGEIFDVAFSWLRGDRFRLSSGATAPGVRIASTL